MAYRRFRYIGVDKVKMDFAFFAIAFNPNRSLGFLCVVRQREIL